MWKTLHVIYERKLRLQIFLLNFCCDSEVYGYSCRTPRACQAFFFLTAFRNFKNSVTYRTKAEWNFKTISFRKVTIDRNPENQPFSSPPGLCVGCGQCSITVNDGVTRDRDSSTRVTKIFFFLSRESSSAPTTDAFGY